MEFFADALNAYARTLNDLAAMLVGRGDIFARRDRPAYPSPLQTYSPPVPRIAPEPRAKAEVGATELKMLNRDLQVVLGDFNCAFYKVKAEVENGRRSSQA